MICYVHFLTKILGVLMNDLSENLKIAHAIKAEVKHQVICSNDIIPRDLMPSLYVDYMPLYQAMFGVNLIQKYLDHSNFASSIRNILSQEAGKITMLSPSSTVALAITRYGVGECQEIATFCYDKLIEQKLSNVAFIVLQVPIAQGSKTPQMHCLVLLGDGALQLRAGSDIKVLNKLPDHVVALDAYLNHVGPANRYLQEQRPYLDQFNYDKIIVCDRPTELHFQNQPQVHENVEQLTTMVAHAHFYRNFLNLSLSCFSISALLPCHETALVKCLNAASGLVFAWGHQDCKVSAYTDVSLSANEEKAKALQETLQAGTFYRQGAQSLFVLHQINAQPDLGKRITSMAPSSGPC